MENKDEYLRSQVTDEFNTPAPGKPAETDTEYSPAGVYLPDAEYEQHTEYNLADNEFALPAADPESLKAERAEKKKTLSKKLRRYIIAAVASVAVVSVSLTTFSSVICPICHTRNCSYWEADYIDSSQGTEGVYLRESDLNPVALVVPTDTDAYLSNSAYRLAADLEGFSCHRILTEDGNSVYVGFDILFDTIKSVYGTKKHYYYSEDSNVSEISGVSTAETYCGCRMYSTEDRDSQPYYAYVEAIYLPDGSTPDSDNKSLEIYSLDTMPYSTYHKYDGQANLWIRAYSCISQSHAEELCNKVIIEVRPYALHEYAIGSTMMVEEKAEGPLLRSAHLNYTYLETVTQDGTDYKLGWKYTMSTYSFDGMTLEFCGYDYSEIFEKMNALNAAAPRSGHKTLCSVLSLQRETVNGITYDVYLEVNETDDGSEYSTLYFVPLQEKGVAIRMSSGISNAYNGADLHDISNGNWESILSQISLRGNRTETKTDDLP